MKRIDTYRRIVFDFNGTLLDDVWLGIRTVNAMLSARNLKTIDTLEEYYHVFGFPIEDYYRRVGFDFEKEPYDNLAVEWIEGYRREEKNVTLREGAIELLDYLRARNVPLYILSATEEKMLGEQLADLHISSYFEEIFGRSDIYARDKTAIAASCAERFSEGQTLYIGDTDHDADSAVAMGAECILLTGGHQSRALLERTGLMILPSLTALLEYLDEETD